MPENNANPKGFDLEPSHIEKFKKVAVDGDKVPGDWLIVLAQFDPDGYGTAELTRAALEAVGAKVDERLFYAGTLGHPQNQAIVHQFDSIRKLASIKDLPAGGPIALVDSSKFDDSRFGPPGTISQERFRVIVDHHSEPGVANQKDPERFIWNAPAGAATTLAFRLAKAVGANLDEDLCTLAAIGIHADTDRLTSERTKPVDRQAFNEAMDKARQERFIACSNYTLPERCKTLMGETLVGDHLHEGFRLAHPDTLLKPDEGDYLSIFADHLLRYGGATAVIVWGITKADLRASIRWRGDRDMTDLIEAIFGKGNGGGKHGCGGARVLLHDPFIPTDDTVGHLIKFFEEQFLRKLKEAVGSSKKREDDSK